MKRGHRIRSHCVRGGRVTLAVFGAGLSLGLGGAGATEPSAGMLPVVGSIDDLSAEPEDARLRPPSWLGPNLFYAKGGLEYRRVLKLGDHPIELGFQGPAMQRKKRAGVTVEIRF